MNNSIAHNQLQKFLIIVGLLTLGVALLWPTPVDAAIGGSALLRERGLAETWGKFYSAALVAQCISFTIFFAVSFGLGLLVRDRGWQVGYTRKILAGTLYLTPLLTGYLSIPGIARSSYNIVPVGTLSTAWVTVSTATALLCIGLMNANFRSRSRFLETAFLAIDRPEDRPLTIPWLLTAILATCLVLVVWIAFSPNTAHYVFIALFVAGVGDALAEPVGLKFGRHKYQVRALGTDAMYTRSLQGSACVFLSAVIAVLIVNELTTGFAIMPQFVLALVLVPIVTTIAEAKSPHTWDQPFIVLSCGLTAVSIELLT